MRETVSVMTYDAPGEEEPASEWRAADGTTLLVRPIQPGDAAREQAFVRALSPASRQLRFMDAVRELSPRQLERFTHPDPARELALVALRRDRREPDDQVAVARFALDDRGACCEFAVVVADDWQRRGLGRHLMTRLIAAATARGLREIRGEVSADNHGMLALARSLGFSTDAMPGDARLRRVSLALGRQADCT